MTHGKEFRCDYSNASRTQLFNIRTLSWDSEICSIFGIDSETLPTVTDSDGLYGYTDLDGYFPKKSRFTAFSATVTALSSGRAV